LQLDPAHLPIQTGSEIIYYFDESNTYNILRSTINVATYGATTSTSTFGFIRLHPGTDYTIDYVKGVVTFIKPILQNYVIAVDYQKHDGTMVINDAPAGAYKLIKDETETLPFELKNYYSIGQTKIVRDDHNGNFILRVLDLNRATVLNIGTTNVVYRQTLKWILKAVFSDLLMEAVTM